MFVETVRTLFIFASFPAVLQEQCQIIFLLDDKLNLVTTTRMAKG